MVASVLMLIPERRLSAFVSTVRSKALLPAPASLLGR